MVLHSSQSVKTACTGHAGKTQQPQRYHHAGGVITPCKCMLATVLHEPLVAQVDVEQEQDVHLSSGDVVAIQEPMPPRGVGP